MEEKCPICKKTSNGWVSGKHGRMCYDCYKRIEKEKLLERAESVREPCDLRDWPGKDMSELFWLTLVEYQKNPTQKGISTINTIYLWACHDNHTLSNTIRHALKWCGIDLFSERRRWQKED